MRDHGRTKVIRNEGVLVLKPRCSEGASATPSSVSVDGLTNVLKSIPVKSCREMSHGTVVVKFPHGEAKAEARALVGSSADFTDVVVSKPKKMLPKMTLLDVPHLYLMVKFLAFWTIISKFKNYSMLDTP